MRRLIYERGRSIGIPPKFEIENYCGRVPEGRSITPIQTEEYVEKEAEEIGAWT